jgi:hypothetical protein
MKITAKGVGQYAKISGITLKNGTHNYRINHKDPLTAHQLAELRGAGFVTFDEILPDDLLKATEKALNEGTLRIHSEPKKIKGKPPVSVYVSSTLPAEVKKNAKPIRSDDKPTKRTRRNNS